MKTDLELRHDGMKILRTELGLVEAERFLTLMLREPFDYKTIEQKSRHRTAFPFRLTIEDQELCTKHVF